MANGSLDRAVQQAKALKRTLDELYQAREAGEVMSATHMKMLEGLVEDIATHPALAESTMFRVLEARF